VRLAYLLPHPELSGGNKVAFQHAALLAARGHRVTVLAEGPRPAWADFAGPYVDLAAGEPPGTGQDLVIATYWTTVERAGRLALGPLAHFCQGYEGGLDHLLARREEIEAVYRRRLPTLAVAPHLVEFLARRFGRESRLAPPPVDPVFRPALRRAPRRRPWIAVPGIYAAEVKGVATALAAIGLLRQEGFPCRLLRFATHPLSPEEAAVLTPDRYLDAVPAAALAAALRRCDLLLFPSLAGEGFGLPLLEALATKVPVVASEIPSARYIAGGAAVLVPPGDARAFATAAAALLGDPQRWREARERGQRAARRFAPARVAALLEGALEWARAHA
jgi:glycosyltransferase involved in cell wall biosynthesis